MKQERLEGPKLERQVTLSLKTVWLFPRERKLPDDELIDTWFPLESPVQGLAESGPTLHVKDWGEMECNGMVSYHQTRPVSLHRHPF